MANQRVPAYTTTQLCNARPLEQNTDIRVIQVLLGHAKVDTTALYTHVATNTIREVMSPLDRLTPLMPQKSEPKDEPPTNVQRACRAQRWRSRTFSATMGPLGVKPMPAR